MELGGGKPVDDHDAVYMMLRQVRSGWRKCHARSELDLIGSSFHSRWENKLLSLNTKTVEALPRGEQRIHIKGNKDKDKR